MWVIERVHSFWHCFSSPDVDSLCLFQSPAAIKCFEGMASTGIDHGVMETDELHQAGEFLIERGHYSMCNGENVEVDKGK